MRYKKNENTGFFDESSRLEKLTEKKDVFYRLSKHIDFEIFRPLLEQGLNKKDKGKGGASPYDYVMMFKILILQRYYNIGYDKIEFAILDRLSFMRFLGLSLSDRVPDGRKWSGMPRTMQAAFIFTN